MPLSGGKRLLASATLTFSRPPKTSKASHTVHTMEEQESDEKEGFEIRDKSDVKEEGGEGDKDGATATDKGEDKGGDVSASLTTDQSTMRNSTL